MGEGHQIVHAVICYLGLSGRFVWFDYKGINPETSAAGVPLLYLALTAADSCGRAALPR